MMQSFFELKPTLLAVHLDSNTDKNPDDSPDISVIPSTEWVWGKFAEAVRYSLDEDSDDENLNDSLADRIDEQGASSGATLPCKNKSLMSCTEFREPKNWKPINNRRWPNSQLSKRLSQISRSCSNQSIQNLCPVIEVYKPSE